MQAEALIKPERIAIVAGVDYTEVPGDLFIPPDALEVLLDLFSGPLDLLLYLIRKQNIDILDIPIHSITKQYLHYIRLMECRTLELAADYLLMAAVLAEIKSKLLLPAPPNELGEEEEDPRMALVRRLQAYEEIKQASALLDGLFRQDRDHFSIEVNPAQIELIKQHPDVSFDELIEAMSAFLQKEDRLTHHHISREATSVRERMSQILQQLQEYGQMEFKQLFTHDEGRQGLVVSLLAILELARQFLLVITQDKAYSALFIQAA